MSITYGRIRLIPGPIEGYEIHDLDGDPIGRSPFAEEFRTNYMRGRGNATHVLNVTDPSSLKSGWAFVQEDDQQVGLMWDDHTYWYQDTTIYEVLKRLREDRLEDVQREAA